MSTLNSHAAVVAKDQTRKCAMSGLSVDALPGMPLLGLHMCCSEPRPSTACHAHLDMLMQAIHSHAPL